MIDHVQLAELQVVKLLVADIALEDVDNPTLPIPFCGNLHVVRVPLTLQDHCITGQAVEGVLHLADARQLVVDHTQVFLTLFQYCEAGGADIADNHILVRLFIFLCNDVMGEFCL